MGQGKSHRLEIGKIKTLVIFLPPTLGDTINHRATLRSLCSGLPNAKIIAISSGLGLEILQTWPIDGVKVIPRKNAWFHLWQAKPDIALFPYVQNKYLRLAARLRIPTRIGLSGGKHDDLLTHPIARIPGEHQIFDLSARMLAEINLDHHENINISGEILNLPPILAFMTGGSEPQKKWPLQHFQETALHFKNQSYQIINIGGPEEKGALQSIADKDTAGTANWVETANILASVQLLITNDTGIMHLAAAVGTPTVSLFMKESPAEYAPLGSNHILLTPPITPDQVISAANQQLEKQF